MPEDVPHISVCICTFKRPHLLSRLFDELSRQNTEGLFTYSIVIADNDVLQSSREMVSQFRDISSTEIVYCVEPEQNIALARNKALANAKGEFIAFIDDDELPQSDWLLGLFKICEAYNADGALGPVFAQFESDPPAWVKKGGFCERRFSHPSGFRIDWTDGRTGNVLFRRAILNGVAPVFRPQFGSGGEDRDFFKRMIENGCLFVWCNEGVTYERVPPTRWKRSFMLRRALLRGKVSLNQYGEARDVAKSLLAVVGYTFVLPILFLMGHHLFMRYLIKTCDHSGRLLAFVGLDLVREKYVLE